MHVGAASEDPKRKNPQPAPQLALRVAEASDVVIDGFRFAPADGAVLGESSVGAFVVNSTEVVFRRVVIEAGDGAAGADGIGIGTAAPVGATGNGGSAACTASAPPNTGGEAVETWREEAASGSRGGKGGDGGNADSSAGGG